MPVITLRINTRLSRKTSDELLQGVSELTALMLKKPLADVMVLLSRCEIARGGKMVPAAFIECRHCGTIDSAVSTSLCSGINRLLQKLTGIEAPMVYANFIRVEQEHALRFDRGAA
jgi:phenylpyruvate tautomerase PptA (4-oxalocrotonate tautomerase family)